MIQIAILIIIAGAVIGVAYAVHEQAQKMESMRMTLKGMATVQLNIVKYLDEHRVEVEENAE